MIEKLENAEKELRKNIANGKKNDKMCLYLKLQYKRLYSHTHSHVDNDQQ